MSNTNTEEFTHACACVVKFWVWVDVSIKSEFEGMNGRGLLCIFGHANVRIVDGKKES